MIASDKEHIRHCILLAFLFQRKDKKLMLAEAAEMICRALDEYAATRSREGDFNLKDRECFG